MLSPVMNFNLGQPDWTTDQLVARYIKIKDDLAAAAKHFSDLCAPYKTEQEQIEGELMNRLNALGGDGRQSIKTESGTVYRSTIVTPKITDRDAYLDAVMDNWETFGSGMLQLMAPKKEAVEDYMSTNNGALPPGVETSSFTRINIRRS